MKKTIAKIMAAAVALSTVVAPNVSAATSVNDDGAVWVKTLTVGGASILDGNAGSYADPVKSGFSRTVSSTGYVTSITTNAAVDATAGYYDGDELIWYDGTNIIINTSVAAVSASVTDVVREGTEDTSGGYNVTKVTADNLKTALNLNTSKTGDELAALVINEMIDKGYVTVKNVASGDIKKSVKSATVNNTTTTSSLTVSDDGAFAAENFATANMFTNVAINANGTITLTVNPSTDNTAKINDAYNNGGHLFADITLTFADNARKMSDGKAIGTRSVYFDLTNGSAYDGFVLLKQDNNKYLEVGVNYTVTSEDAGASDGFVTIDAADNDLLKSEYAKGGRLLLDYVYDWDNDDYGLATTDEFYKIRRIGSRVFKEGKFQQISGLGDDGAQYIRIINNGAFRKCKQLKKVNLDTSKKLRKINAKAFYDCKKLATVKMDGRNLKAIGSNAFKGTKSNITFKIKGNKNQFNKAVKKIKKNAPSKAKYSKI